MSTTHHVQSFSVGAIQIAKILDSLEPTSPRFMYVDKRKDDFDPYLDWLQPHFVNDKKLMLLSIHAFILKTRHHTIMVDTCIGNDKRGLAFEQWNGRRAAFLQDCAAAGCGPEAIDYVFCTHLHLDHTGWNTRLEDGRWVPTFPNATYLFSTDEWQHWKDAPAPEGPSRGRAEYPAHS